VPNARIDAREGGSYWTRLDANLVREAHIDVFKPPRRLRLIYMPLPNLPDNGSVLVDDFLIDTDQAASREMRAPHHDRAIDGIGRSGRSGMGRDVYALTQAAGSAR
jgi:hypothetical protein